MEDFNQYCLENEFIDFGFQPVNELSDYIKKLDRCFKKESDNFAEICFIVYRIKKLFDDYKQVYLKKNSNMAYSFDTIMQGFGISKSESSRILSCYYKFITKETEKPMIFAEFFGFSKSKLFELLQVDDETLRIDLKNKVIRFDFSVKQIREYVKNYQAQMRAKQRLANGEEENKEENDVFDESQIPMAYEPDKEYEFSYFETKTKSQLLNMIWDLQKAYQKLKKEKKKK